jgi:hypothetical protein
MQIHTDKRLPKVKIPTLHTTHTTKKESRPIMDHVLTPQQEQWVERTLNALPLEHAIAQLFNVSRPLEDPAAWAHSSVKTIYACFTFLS